MECWELCFGCVSGIDGWSSAKQHHRTEWASNLKKKKNICTKVDLSHQQWLLNLCVPLRLLIGKAAEEKEGQSAMEPALQAGGRMRTPRKKPFCSAAWNECAVWYSVILVHRFSSNCALPTGDLGFLHSDSFHRVLEAPRICWEKGRDWREPVCTKAVSKNQSDSCTPVFVKTGAWFE